MNFPVHLLEDTWAARLQVLMGTAKPLWMMPAPLLENWLADLRGPDRRMLCLAEGTLPLAPESGWLRGGELYFLRSEALLPSTHPSGDAAELAEDLTHQPEVTLLLMLQLHPDTGAQLEIDYTLARARRAQPGLRAVLDATHALGFTPLYTDAWGLDACYVLSQGFAIVAGDSPGWAQPVESPTLGLQSALAAAVAGAGPHWWADPTPLALRQRWQAVHQQAEAARVALADAGLRLMPEWPLGMRTLGLLLHDEAQLALAAAWGELLPLALPQERDPSLNDYHVLWLDAPEDA